MLNDDEIKELKCMDIPCFVRVKRDHVLKCVSKGLSPCFYYICTRKGWDLKNNGKEVYYINELGKWIPTRYLDVITGMSPN